MTNAARDAKLSPDQILSVHPSDALQEFVRKRDEVEIYIRKTLREELNVEKVEASAMVQSVKMFKINDVENLYKCINSNFDNLVKKSIVMHDFYGLRNGSMNFVPKSAQFERS